MNIAASNTALKNSYKFSMFFQRRKKKNEEILCMSE